MTTVDLWASDDCHGVIVLLETGVSWTNQVGGTMCSHPTAVGVFLPMWEFTNAGDPLFEQYIDWDNSCLDIVAEFLRATGLDWAFEPRLADFVAEAWVPVRFLPAASSNPMFAGFVGRDGFLTYPNSD